MKVVDENLNSIRMEGIYSKIVVSDEGIIYMFYSDPAKVNDVL